MTEDIFGWLILGFMFIIVFCPLIKFLYKKIMPKKWVYDVEIKRTVFRKGDGIIRKVNTFQAPCKKRLEFNLFDKHGVDITISVKKVKGKI